MAVIGLASGSAAPEDGRSFTAIARVAAQRAERRALEPVLDRVHWKQRQAARLFKARYRTLRRKIEQCGLAD